LEIPQPAFNTYQTLRDFYWHTGRFVDMNAVAKRQVLTLGRHYMGLSFSYALMGLWDQASYWDARTMVDTNWFWAKFFGPTSVPYLQGRYRDSLVEWDKALTTAGTTLSEMPHLVTWLYGDTQALAGDFGGAIRNMEPLIGTARPISLAELEAFERDALHSLIWSYQQIGMPDRARPLLESLERQLEEKQGLGLLHMSNDLFFYARNALLMGEKDLALERLEQAVEAGWRDYYVQQNDPRWTPVAEDPRYQALMAEVKADVDRQRAEVERIDAEEDFVAWLDAARAERQQ
jgi:tetratricopeptide (TPR) repeat protein